MMVAILNDTKRLYRLVSYQVFKIRNFVLWIFVRVEGGRVWLVVKKKKRNRPGTAIG